jgi:AraC family transcriptional regulator
MTDVPPRVIAVDTRSARSRTLAAGGFVVTDVSYQPRVTAPHAHERDMCTITLEGAWQEIRRRHGVHDCARGTAVVKSAGEVHTDVFLDPGMRVLVVEIDSATSLGTLRSCFGILERKAFLRDEVGHALGRRIVRELDETDASTPTIIEGLALEMFGTLARLHGENSGARHPLWLQRARELIHHDFAAPLRVDEIARIVDVHPVRLARGFRRYIGQSPGEYMRRVRLEWTTLQLSSTDESVASIAARAGFADQSHFTRVFRRHMGVTPAVFRSASRHGRKP